MVYQPESDSAVLPDQLGGRREVDWGPEGVDEESVDREVLLRDCVCCVQDDQDTVRLQPGAVVLPQKCEDAKTPIPDAGA